MIIIPYILAILKNMIYGSSIFFTSSLTENCDVLDILALRFLVSFGVMWVLKVTRIIKIGIGVRDFFKKGNRSPMLRTLLLTAIFEPVLYMVFETLGISMTTNVTTAIILALTPVTACTLEVLFLRERCTGLEKIFLGAGIVGVVYVALKTDTGGGENSVFGIICIILAVISGSLFTVFSRKSSSAFSAMEITYTSCLLGAVAFNAINIVRHIANGTVLRYFEPYLSLSNIIGFIFLGVISTIVATGMNNFCLGRMQASTMSAFGGLSTVTTILIGVFIGGEELYYYHYIGVTLILIRAIGVSTIAILRDRRKIRAQENSDTPEKSNES